MAMKRLQAFCEEAKKVFHYVSWEKDNNGMVLIYINYKNGDKI